MSDDPATRQEEISFELLNRRFSDLGDLQSYLNNRNIEYILEQSSIAIEPPRETDIAWDSRTQYYLALLPRNPNKLYRFRIYPTNGGGLHVEADFAYRNPYQ